MYLLLHVLPAILLIPIIAALARPVPDQDNTSGLARGLLGLWAVVMIPACSFGWFMGMWASGEEPYTRDAEFVALVSLVSWGALLIPLLGLILGILASREIGSVAVWMLALDVYFCSYWLSAALLLPPLTQHLGEFVLALGTGAALGGGIWLLDTTWRKASSTHLSGRLPGWAWVPIFMAATGGGLLIGALISLSIIYNSEYKRTLWSVPSAEFVSDVIGMGVLAGVVALIGGWAVALAIPDTRLIETNRAGRSSKRHLA